VAVSQLQAAVARASLLLPLDVEHSSRPLSTWAASSCLLRHQLDLGGLRCVLKALDLVREALLLLRAAQTGHSSRINLSAVVEVHRLGKETKETAA
jgi:hypothetical protein